MNYPPPPHWSQGMFFTPQHMQAFSRHLSGRISHISLGTAPYRWGVTKLELDEPALENYEFKVRKVEATLRDGTVVRFPEEGEVPVRDFSDDLAEGSKTLDVYLGIPEFMAQRPNAVEEAVEGNGTCRYRVVAMKEADENTGTDNRDIDYRHLQARIFVGEEDRAGYHCLRLARLGLTGGHAEPRPMRLFDDIPAITRIGADAHLYGEIRDFVTGLTAGAQELGSQVASRDIRWGGEGSSNDAELMWRLRAVNSSLAELLQISATGEVHPFDCYLALCRLVGELAIFDSRRVLPDVPVYNHLDIGGCFKAVLKEAKGLLQTSVPDAFVAVQFTRSPEGLMCTLKNDWLDFDVPLFLGVKIKQAVEEKLDRNAVGKMVNELKLCASRQIDELIEVRLSGIEKNLLPTEEVPRELPGLHNYHYWTINRDSRRWKLNSSDPTLALIGNDSTLDHGTLEFWLFVVEPTS